MLQKPKPGLVLPALTLASVLVVGFAIYSRFNSPPASPGLPAKHVARAGEERYVPAPDMDFEMPPIVHPKIVPASDSLVFDHEEIVGIRVAGKYRAYSLHGLSSSSSHVVNDLLGSQAVSVAYCTANQCVKVYTKGSVSAPLDVSMGGWRKPSAKSEGGLVLTAKKKRYLQKSGKSLEPGSDAAFPYTEMKFVRTTWKAWRKAHPDTDIWNGG
jgi:hypothetical protein